ncbi:MAG: ABC transporter permease [Verrucomicrobiales bacterium]|nr:ABC transporter permease [Verrucomicrobiales bacterium]
MKNALLIGHNDLRMFLREKVGYVWLFVVPVLFVVFMGFANRGPGSPSSPQPPVLVENLDQGPLGALLIEALTAQGLNTMSPTNAADAQRGVRIPAGFTARLHQKEQVRVEFFTVEGSGDESAAMIELRLVRALIAFNAAILERAAGGAGEAVFDPSALTEILQRPGLIQVETSFAGRRPMPVGFRQSVPGNLVMFLMLNGLIFGGASLAGERQTGVLRRLAVQPLHRRDLVLGKIYGRFLLACGQALMILLVGQFALGVPVFTAPLAMGLVIATYAWTCAALGVLIGATARNPDKIVGLCILSALLMAAIGGCWWPAEMTPEWMQLLARTVPTGWAMAGLHAIITFGGGLSDALLEAAVLAGFGLAGTVLAGRVLRY